MTAERAHRWAVDAIEEGVARIEEDGSRMITVPAYLLPPGVTEGQLLRVVRAAGPMKGEVVITIALDPEATAVALKQSKAAMASAMKASKKRDPGGDVSL